jgi:hypothetical protein
MFEKRRDVCTERLLMLMLVLMLVLVLVLVVWWLVVLGRVEAGLGCLLCRGSVTLELKLTRYIHLKST